MGERERRCAVRCVCEVVVGDARVAVANGGCEREMGREPLSVAYPLSMFAATCPPLEPSRAARSSPLSPLPRVPGRPALIVPLAPAPRR